MLNAHPCERGVDNLLSNAPSFDSLKFCLARGAQSRIALGDTRGSTLNLQLPASCQGTADFFLPFLDGLLVGTFAFVDGFGLFAIFLQSFLNLSMGSAGSVIFARQTLLFKRRNNLLDEPW